MSNQPRGAPIPSLLTDLQKFVYSVPPVTRYLVFGTLVFSLSAQIGLCKAHQLMLSFSDLTQSFEIWRLCTAHLFSSGPNMIWHLYMLYQNSRSLEDGYYSTRPADYAFFIILVMSVLDVIGLFFGYPLLTESFGMAITYMYAMSRGR
ncbi:hypothetical protein BASA62_001817 [Batrachochytrium salamandrivorans]|nr:hypothetical protein BASA62_001817 [Batrachochytrium salamandrivorans]